MTLARDRFKAIQDSEREQRERELEDLRFYAGDQWPTEIQNARKGQNATSSLPAVPSRPCITINKTREPVRQVLNQERQSDLGVTLVPADDFEGISEPVSDDEVTLREGLIRRIQRTSDAKAARTWAFERAAIAGRGYYGVMVKFGEGKTWDREIYVERYYNQNAISLGAHVEPDGSDADHGFVGGLIPWNQYELEYPFAADGKKNTRLGSSDEDFKALGEDYPDWFKRTGDKKTTRMVRVVRYWYTELTSRELVRLADGSSAWKDEAPSDAEIIDSRTVLEKTVKVAKIDGTQKLEETEWESPYIPIIKVLGEELHPYDDQYRAEGMVRPGIEAGRGFNYMVSKMVEQVGLTPIPPIIVDPESIEPFLDWWKLGSTRALFMLPQLTRDEQGREFREAHRPNVDPNLQPLAMVVQMFSEFLQSTMGVHDPSLGKVDPRLKSGSAIKAVVNQDAQGTSNYIDNLGRSVHYEGIIENSLLYSVYGENPGRLAKIVNAQNESEDIIVNRPFTMQGGKPQPVMVPHPNDPTQQIPASVGHPMVPPDAKTYTLTKGANLNVVVKVAKENDLLRDQLASFLGELVAQNPVFMTQYGDMLFKALDIPDHEEMAERARTMLDPKIQQMLDAKKQGLDIPPALQQHMAQQGQQLQELEQLAAKLQHTIDTEQVKAGSHERVERMKLDYLSAKTQADNETKIAVAELGAKVDRLSLFMEERARLGLQAHEAGLAAADAHQEVAMSDQEHQQGIASDAHGMAGDAALAEQAHGHALEQGAQPPPIDPNAPPAEPAAAGA